MSGELVSVITPAHLAESTLAQTIESVISQTHSNWELIVVDDCSADGTAEVARRFSTHDSRVRLIQHSTRGGPATARSTAIGAARGAYLAFLDADDLWAPTKLAVQVAALEHSTAVLCFTSFRRLSADGDRRGRVVRVPRTLNYQQLLGNTAILTSSVLVDRRRCVEIVPKKTFHDDFALWLDLLRRGGWAIGIDEPLVLYRQLPHSYSRRKAGMAVNVWRTYREVEGLGMIASIRYLFEYGVRGAWKYLRF